MKSMGREALAFLRQAVLLPLDIGPLLPEVRSDDDLIILIHGFCASAGVFRPMRRALHLGTGAHVASFTHLPGIGVKRIALTLARMIDRVPHGTRIHLIGHSLGGLVARWYVDELGGYARVAQTISIASPFGGAPAASRLPYFVGADLHPASELLARMRQRVHREVPHLSIMGGADRIVFPMESGAFCHGDRQAFPERGHNTLLFDRDVLALLVERVNEYGAPAPVSAIRSLDREPSLLSA